MKQKANLTSGEIKSSLFSMAIPLMGVAFVQMTYNLVDMFWLGRHSRAAVAAVGTAGLASYIANTISVIGRVGASTWISQYYGRGDSDTAKEYVENGLAVNVAIGFIVSLITFLNRDLFLGLFEISDLVYSHAMDYLTVMSIGFIILFINTMMAGGYNSIGDSKIPFKVSIIGLVANIILDPLFIFGLDMGVSGAAIATVLSQTLVFIGYIVAGTRSTDIMGKIGKNVEISLNKITRIIKTGLPASIMGTTQAIVSTVLNIFISEFGDTALAVYTIAIQIESITWMTSDGFAIAMQAFMGQNLGAEKYDRLERGYKEGMKIFVLIGVIATFVLWFFGGFIFDKFLPGDTEAIAMGITVLKIWAFAEILFAIEIGTNGCLNGLGLTRYPAFNGWFFNIVRIPMSKVLVKYIGLNGIWLTFSITMALKGIFITIIYHYLNNSTNGFRNIGIS